MTKNFPLGLIYRCSGPNCGILKTPDQDGWWLLWTSMEQGTPVLSVAPWEDALVNHEGCLYACGENCAQKLQSTFMSNVTASRNAREVAG
jgi:hypothetical protein